MKLKFLEIPSPLFHGGKNHGVKLFARNGIELEHEAPNKEHGERICIKYNGEPTYMPISSVHNYTPGIAAPEPVQVSHPQDVNKIKTAQVSSPHDHVFQGEGAGVKRDR